jgi:hypothetical protein
MKDETILLKPYSNLSKLNCKVSIKYKFIKINYFLHYFKQSNKIFSVYIPKLGRFISALIIYLKLIAYFN